MKRCVHCRAEMEAQESVCPRCGYTHKTRTELIRKLLESHLNVPELRELVPPAIHFSEVVAVIRDVLEREGRFLALEKLEGGKHRVHRLLGGEEIAMSVYGPSVDVIEDYPNLDCAVQALWNQSEINGIKILGVPT